ncbi:family 16 glycosylhydrolase [Massilia sp. Dwa41.01b]|uniref:carbohydrate binding domain-containing protein n=1 Tax=unclassified Massilia TaxID=2609279 RepID=UPI0015FED40F|nr:MULTISPECIES: carbohydrate binding domain-containing protein [unclassified Massilia]QNA90114.1 family 16 glycosylhydrolase [Massilia sp. Dwa41.01b]QNB01004.1 family 16 glycosylhydrolase [Massilia sp. Se16.2.3]
MFRYKNLLASAGIALVLGACGGSGSDPQPTLATAGKITPIPGPNPPTSTVLWSDEFNGNSLDPAKWGYQLGNGATVGNPGWGNNELEYYTDRPENVRVEGGNLVITARKEAFRGTAAGGNEGQTFGWTSGRIRSAGKFSRTYGKIEFRAKLPVGKGFWPAVWMLPEDNVGNPYATWAANGEIDIMEGMGSKPTKIAQTLHYGGMWPRNIYTSNEATIGNNGKVSEWHTYTLEWRSNEITWSIDGVVTSTQTKWWSSNVNPPDSDDDLNAWPAPFDKPFYVLINLAVGGNFDGNPDAATPDKGEMLVDYIRWSMLPDEKRDPGPRPAMKYPWTPANTVGRPPVNGNLVYNPSFDWTASHTAVTQSPDVETIAGVNNSYFWNLFKLNGDAVASNDGGAIRIGITDPGSEAWNVQLQHNNIALTEGRKYRLSFDARASSNRSMSYTVGAGQDRGFESYSGGDHIAELTTGVQRFTRSFDMQTGTNNAARVVFNLATAGINTVWIDNVVVEDIGAADVPDGPPVGVNLLRNGDFASGLAPDWTTWASPGTGSLAAAIVDGSARLVVLDVDPSNNWHVQLNQPSVPLVKGRSYTLTFKGAASLAGTVGVVIGENGGSYARYLDAGAALTPAAGTYSYTFTSPVTNAAAQLQILGAFGAAGDDYSLSFDDFSLVANP